jgi:hypothetical protein
LLLQYYQLVEVAAIGDIHGIKLIINIPLKTANSHFTLYKTIALPTRISDDKFVKYVFDHPYFGLDNDQHDYILLSEADLLHCKTSSITIGPADVAIITQVHLHVKPVYFFRELVATIFAEEVYIYTIKLRRCNSMEQSGCISSRNHSKLSYTARQSTTGHPAQRYCPVRDSYATLHGIPFPSAKSER